MKIKRVILKGVRNFEDFDRSFEDTFSNRVPDSLLLLGPNGSGKTTLLNTFADLWSLLESYLREEGKMSSALERSLRTSTFAAIEIVDWEPRPVWIIYSNDTDEDADLDNYLNKFIAEQAISHRLIISPLRPALFLSDRDELPLLSYDYVAPDSLVKGNHTQRSEWQQRWSQRLTESIYGKQDVNDLPNVVYLESETRALLPLTEKFSVQPEPKEFRWLAQYEPTTSRKGSIQNYLYNLKVVDETVFKQIVEEVNAFLIGKRLDEFDPRSGELMVQVESRGRHSINDLSSGEKQVLLMLATITRWLQPGGIVLIDEPDLHLHVSLSTAFVGHLRRMVAAKNGQLIIASHAPELWNEFTASHRVELGQVSEAAR